MIRPARRRSPSNLPEPAIDYLARDYESLRRQLTDRLATTYPGGIDEHAPDLGLALVELFAYLGDHLSYYQDAVATEAYIGTARILTSVRRHARLLGRAAHGGTNARTWIHLEAPEKSDIDIDAGAIAFCSLEPRITSAGLNGEPAVGQPRGEVFLPVRSEDPKIHARRARNKLDVRARVGRPAIERGATTATLEGTNDAIGLAPGDVLLFEERTSGELRRTSPPRCHPVRVQTVAPLRKDRWGSGEPGIENGWSDEDAPPFDLEDVVVRANVVLVEHGREIVQEGLSPRAPAPLRGRRPEIVLDEGPLTCAEPTVLRRGTGTLPSASALLVQDPRRALPVIELREGDKGPRWEPRRDLLRSGWADRHFVAETDSRGRAHLRFGDGGCGAVPTAALTARFRLGNGPEGNVPAGALRYFVLLRAGAARLSAADKDATLGDALRSLQMRQPLPAVGGTAPETIEEARSGEASPEERLITTEDYAYSASSHPRVRGATAVHRWTGSGEEILVIVDPRGGSALSDSLRDEVRGLLEPLRRVGHEIVVACARYVPVDLALRVDIDSGHRRAAVAKAVRAAIVGPGGPFHAERRAFGEGVSSGRILAAVQAVSGVESVTLLALRREGEGGPDVPDDGILRMGTTEIPVLPSGGEHPRIEIRGGQ